MKYIDLTLPTPAANLACDEALLDLAEAEGGEWLRFWEPREVFVVLGYANRAAVETDLAACKACGISVFRRCTGGGTVLQGPGCLNYSLILQISSSTALQSIPGTNDFILQRQKSALQPLVKAPMQIQGHTDLALGAPVPLKFSGNAQRRKRNFLIFHGTFLLNFDISLVEKVLPMPSKEPPYRAGRPHTRFLTNLDIPAGQVKAALRNAWAADDTAASVPMEAISRLTETKYATADWSLRH